MALRQIGLMLYLDVGLGCCRIGLDPAPNAHRHFDARDDGWTKVVLHMAAALRGLAGLAEAMHLSAP